MNEKRLNEILRELNQMVFKSKSPQMDNSHIFDIKKAKELLKEFDKIMNEG